MSTVITADHPPIAPEGAAMIAVDVIMLFLASLWTCMRVWVRRHKHISPFHAEDILCYLALLCYYGAVTGHIVSVVGGGVGHHTKNLSSYHIQRYSKLSFFAQIIYGPVIGLVKLSIILMLRRIFFTSKFRFACYAVMIVAVAWTAMPVLVAILVCRPLEFTWNRNVPGGHCGNKTLAYALVGVVDLISDALILALPMRMVYKLRISRAHKIALAGIFGFGTVTMVFTAIRLYYVYNLDVLDITYATVVPSIIGSLDGLVVEKRWPYDRENSA
ncbi:Satratoxin biosynthesis SC1 cluster protein 4 [Colletotrichum trifolii]|uniref:Satratoxin biosynthesis SC1 cluster protein 4 n=1 Tax=Colletotrichum trifolii TaxID=5466 RepID=A0A4R8RTU5_COLTR|nr:Satratoxin biosynthesis SC1 cluster protein 4 [Colletotrichum trifolii]